MKTRIKLGLISLVLVSLLFGVYIGYSATPSNPIWISSGVYPGAPSYTIWREGYDYFAKDQNGYIAFSGTNASKIVNNCIESMPSQIHGYDAGIIHFNNGEYKFDSSIIINKPNIILEGEGRATEFQPSSASLDAIVLVYTETDAIHNTHATEIRDIIFYNPNWATYNDTVGVRYHNNIDANYGISFPSVKNCWFTRIDAITTDTSGFDNWTYQLVTGIHILDCKIDHPPHFFLKLWNTIDGTIQNIYATLEGGTDTVGIELYYPTALSTGLFFDDVAIIGATVGINFTNGAEGWFQSVVTDLCTDYGFYIENSNRTMLTNTYSSTGNASQGSSYRLVNSYNARFESCTAFNSKYGIYSCVGTSALFNYFIGTISKGCGTADWYNIHDYDVFTACNYIVQNANVTATSSSTSVVVNHGLSGTPDVVTVTLGTTGSGDYYVDTITSTQFTVHVTVSGSYTVYWFACMSKHLP